MRPLYLPAAGIACALVLLAGCDGGAKAPTSDDTAAPNLDAGEGNDTQYVDDVDDSQWDEKFELPYAELAFPFHPVLGNHEGLDWIPIVNGEAIQDFVEDGRCGAVDVYLCGHDHSLQWPEGDNATGFESDQPGFVWVEIDGRTFTAVFYDAPGTETFRRTFTK
jgi:hypothetical protein